jgi:RNA polymerase sigma-70 factor (sigma-E family)
VRTLARDRDAGPRADALPADPDAALRVLYATHWGPMVRLATLLLGSTSAAEEVVQDAFVSTYRHLPGLRDPQRAGGYLRTSVVNGTRSWHRHRQVEERHREPSPTPPLGPDDVAAQVDADALVMSALRRLPRRQQEVLVLRYHADASEAEIAELCGISRGAVKTHAHRGLAALRTALTEVLA